MLGNVPLTPLSLLDRSATVHSDRVAFVEPGARITYAELHDRVSRVSGLFRQLGIAAGDRVSVLAPNTLSAFEAHFAVPGAGAVLNAINMRLSPPEIAAIMDHAGSHLLLCDHELLALGQEAVSASAREVRILICGHEATEYEQRLLDAPPFRWTLDDEMALLSLNYTSGTTGRPKGAMYAHRGAFLQALAMIAQAGLDSSSVFPWTLPMFHANGWCFPWAVAGVGGTNVGLRHVRPEAIWTSIRESGVSHFNAAPTVLTMLADHELAAPTERSVRVATGGAPPSPALLSRLAALNIYVTHLYGLTETYGPAVICDWRPEWNDFSANEQAVLKARQGVANLVSPPLTVVDGNDDDVPWDGETRGEVLLRGNTIMIGYYQDTEATAAATVVRNDGVWFRTGDTGVMHPDGYLELRDRAKDVIISGVAKTLRRLRSSRPWTPTLRSWNRQWWPHQITPGVRCRLRSSRFDRGRVLRSRSSSSS